MTQTTLGDRPCSLPSPKLMTRLHAQELWASSAPLPSPYNAQRYLGQALLPESVNAEQREE